jgi:3-oxoacyl-[acyl-carrier protein] reductase
MKRVLVTGGSRGLGLAICKRLLADRFMVITASRKISPELSELMAANPKALEHHAIDFADANAAPALSEAAELLDGLYGFVANAAVGTEGLLTLTPEATVRRCVEVNLVAPMLLARAAIKGMLGRAEGSLVFIASVAARTGFAGLSAYSATKGGLVSFSRSLAREYGEKGIRSNAVLPGFLQTEMSQGLTTVDRERIIRRTALKRLGSVEDVVGVVSFLLSDEARYVTGSEIVADGGMTA